MPGKRLTEAQKRAFFKLIGQGVPTPVAAERSGFSAVTGWRLTQGLDEGSPKPQSIAQRERQDAEQPDPRPWDQLAPDAQEALRDFNAFCEVFLLRRPVPWRRDAAMRTVEALRDRSRRSYLVTNEPPGSGKTTLFTCDIPLWLICGGGILDPLRGRAIRILLGSCGMSVAVHYVGRLKRLLESPRPFYDKAHQRTAELSLVEAFGRFKPQQAGVPWRSDELVVEQLVGVDLAEKEPTVQAASREKGFLGERVELFVWDDLVTTQNTRNVDGRDALSSWFEDEAETRLEPGGVGLLVGQRLGPDDLYRNRLDVKFTDDRGEDRRKYAHIVYPAHDEAACDGEHRQSDGAGDGCLLDEERLPWPELQAKAATNPRNYRTLYQQEDVDPAGALIDDVWLTGGTDREGLTVPGCWDVDRCFLEWPKGVSGLIDYVSVDPSAGNFWGIEWWAIHPETKVRYLIRGLRSKHFRAGDLLQYDVERNVLTGVMQEWQEMSKKLGHPIRCWVIEGNSAFKHLTQYDHFRAWQRTHLVTVILHKTGLNKTNEQTGVEALLPTLYRQGLKRVPRKGIDALRFSEDFRKELTQYPQGATSDLVMADWQAEWNLKRILSVARSAVPLVVPVKLPPYLRRQQREIPHGDGRGEDSWIIGMPRVVRP